MANRVVFMMGGQGSHYRQMGRALLDGHPTFRKWMHALDELAVRRLGTSVVAEIYDERKRAMGHAFRRTLLTHPAIFMVEWSLAQVLIHEGITPYAVFGSSLGETVAASLAGVLPVEQALESVIVQAEVLERCCPPGGMIAVLADPALYRQHTELAESVELAGVNYHGHFVVSGSPDGIQRALAFLRRESITHVELEVSHGFHSSEVDGLASEYGAYLGRLTLTKPRLLFISAASGGALSEVAPEHFLQVTRKGIDFPRALATVRDQAETCFVDVSPGGALANFLKHGWPQAMRGRVHSVLSAYGSEMKALDGIRSNLLPRYAVT
jgi:acyl transferase domain-containing protein